MQNKNTSYLKRSAIQITSDSDINTTDDFLLDVSRQIFIHHFCKKYEMMEISLYQIDAIRHNEYPNIVVIPHFVRDDGVVIYLQLLYNNKYLKMVREDMIHVSMEILKIKNACIFTIILDSSIDVNDMQRLLNINIAKTYINILEKKIHYSPIIAKKYILSLSNKRTKITQNTTPINENSSSIIFNRNDWISASKTRNYALKDTLVDWLDFYYDKSSEKKKFKSNNKSAGEYDFTKYIMEKGIQFESNVINLIKKKINSNDFVTICTDMKNYDQKILEYEQKTKDEIIKGTPIIYQGILMNRTGDLSYTYGSPDLLVRSDYLSKIVENNSLSKSMQICKATNLKGNYHYVIVDIKFTTMQLCSDGIRIRNSGSTPAYKCQLYIYNHALGHIQGYESKVSFILGRKYKYVSKNVCYFGNNCFDRFGHIEYDDWDKNYVHETINAIQWIKTLRKNGHEWKLLPQPSVSELYPNMSSVSDTQWNIFKEEYANKIGEITLLWNCGVRNREIAHKNGIYSFRDKKCCSENIGVSGLKQAPILNEIIKINKKLNFNNPLDKIFMKINENIDNQWIYPCKLRISVDFETINSVFDDFSELPKAQEKNYLFMIGVAYKVGKNTPQYKMFLITEMSENAEFQMIYQFYKFLRTITDEYLGKKMQIPSLYHWGHIERSFFTNLCNKLENTIGNDIEKDIKLMKTKLKWYDLLECFKGNPIVINGCFKFGLKEVAGRLSELNLIQSKWSNNPLSCVNGNTAMIMAQKAYQICEKTGLCVTENPIMKDIMKYNKIDCIVIHEIVDILQKKEKCIRGNN